MNLDEFWLRTDWAYLLYGMVAFNALFALKFPLQWWEGYAADEMMDRYQAGTWASVNAAFLGGIWQGFRTIPRLKVTRIKCLSVTGRSEERVNVYPEMNPRRILGPDYVQ